MLLPEYYKNTKLKFKKNKLLTINYGLKLKSNVKMNNLSEIMPQEKLPKPQMKPLKHQKTVPLKNKELNQTYKSLKLN